MMFSQFWSIYPSRHGRKVGKALCKAVVDRMTYVDQELLLSAVKHYEIACRPHDGAFIPLPRDPIRFLKQDWWRDWVDKPEVKTVKSAITQPTPSVPGISMHEALAEWPEGLAKLQRVIGKHP